MSPSLGKIFDALARTQSRLGESSRTRDAVLFVTWCTWSMVCGRVLADTVYRCVEGRGVTPVSALFESFNAPFA